MDGDGFVNEYEYYFGLDPNSNANARQPIAGIDSNAPTVRYTFRTDDPAVTYTLQTSTDLVAWGPASWTAILGPTPNGDGTSTITVRSDVDFSTELRQFFRIKAVE